MRRFCRINRWRIAAAAVPDAATHALSTRFKGFHSLRATLHQFVLTRKLAIIFWKTWPPSLVNTPAQNVLPHAPGAASNRQINSVFLCFMVMFSPHFCIIELKILQNRFFSYYKISFFLSFVEKHKKNPVHLHGIFLSVKPTIKR